MKKRQEISAAELEVMQTLWRSGKAMKVQDVCDALESDKWKYRTVATLLLRLEEKGAVKSGKIGKINYYTASLDRDEYVESQTKSFITRLYDGSVKELAASLVKNHNLTDEDIEEIRREFNL